MHVKDIMTTEVVTVKPDTPVETIAELLLTQRISGVPVVDARDRVVGMVSESDLLHRPETETLRSRPWWLAVMARPEEDAIEYLKTHGRRAEQVMTREVVTVTEDMTLGEVATLLEKHRIKRLPVVRDDQLVGIISRANLLHGLVAHKTVIDAPAAADDQALREQIMAALKQRGSLVGLNITVTDGAVELWGWADSDEECRALVLAAERVPGVRAVQSHLGVLPPYIWAE